MSTPHGPQKIGDVLRDLLHSSGLAHTLKHLEVYSAWQEVVGPDIAARTRVAGLSRHKLYVDVDSAAHLHELSTFYKQQILRDLREKLPGILIRDLVFRPAPLHRT